MPPAHDEIYTRLALLEAAVSALQGENERLRADLREEQDARIKREAATAATAGLSVAQRGSVSWWISVVLGMGGVVALLFKIAEWLHVAPSAPKVP